MIQLREITYGYGDRTLLENASLHIRPRDRLALVGPNGTGKTTLLRIINNEIAGFDGTVSRRKGLTVGLLPQDGVYGAGRTVIDVALGAFPRLLELELEIEKLDLEVSAEKDDSKRDDLLGAAAIARQEYEINGGFTFRARAAKILTGLGFHERDYGRDTSEFSGGWQMRAALARLLLQEPDILLLDEPTNHLDLPALIWFENFIQTYDGAVVIVSHDMVFLDRCIRRIAELSMRGIDVYEGNYSFFEMEKLKRLEILENRMENQQREIKRVERFIERFRYKATKARQVQSRIKMLEKIDRIELPDRDRALRFSFRTPRPSGKNVMRLEGVCKSYGENHVLRNVNLSINRGDRIAVIGANGLGKSTLMRVLCERTEYTGERRPGHQVTISYFSQDQYELLSPDKTVLEEAHESSGSDFKGNLRSLLGVFLFEDDDVDKKVRVLSGGEKSRLLMAKMMASPANFLILDEPTNHLDPASQEMLCDVLLDYDGTICFVSHNRFFINTVANRVVEITPDGLEEYIGNYDDYEEQKKLRKEARAGEGETGEGQGTAREGEAPTSDRKAARRERAGFIAERSRALSPIKAEIEKTEDEIARLEARASEIETLLADPATYTDAEKTQTLPSELKYVKTSLEAALEQWELLSDQLAEKEKEFEEK